MFSKILLGGTECVLLLDYRRFNGPFYLLAGDINAIMITRSTNSYLSVGEIELTISGLFFIFLILLHPSYTYKKFKHLRLNN